MKKVLYLGILIILTFGCVPVNSPTTGQSGLDQNTLKVGVSTNYPPIIYKENGKPAGLETDFAIGLADFMGRKLQFIQVKWEDQIPALLSGKTDIIMSGYDYYRFPKIPYCLYQSIHNFRSDSPRASDR